MEQNITIRTVEKYLRENNIQPRKEKSDSLEERITLALRLGKKIVDIAKDEGLSRTRIYQIMKAKGITK